MCRAGANTCHSIQLQDFHHGHLRSRYHRHRSRRICLRDPRGATRHEGRRGREERHARRHLPQRRMHAVEGAAARLRNVRGGRALLREDGRQRFRAETRSARDDEFQAAGHRRQRQGRRVPDEEEQDRRHRRQGQDPRHRQGRGDRQRRQDADRRDQEHRHRHRLRCRAAEGHRDRREAHRVVDRRAVARQGAGKIADRRRRRDRARTRLGVAPARRAGHGGGIPRPHSARHGRRGRQAIPAHPRKAGLCVQARRQGHRRRHLRQDAVGAGRAGRGRQGGNAGGRRGAGRDRPRSLHRGPRPEGSRRRARQSRPRPDRFAFCDQP